MVTDLSGGFGQVPAQGSGRRGQRAAERRRRKRGRRTVVSVLIGLAVLAVAVGGAWVGLRSVLGVFAGPADYPGPGTGEVTVVIPDGASGTVIAQKLQEKDVVKSTGAFLDAAKKDTRSTSIQPGSYSLHKQMSGQQALAALIDPANREVKKVVIREGQPRARPTWACRRRPRTCSRAGCSRPPTRSRGRRRPPTCSRRW